MSLFEKRDLKKARTSIEKIAVALQIREPFFGAVFRRLQKKFTSQTRSIGLCWNGSNVVLWINPKFVCKLPAKETMAMCKHILLHVCLKHLSKAKGKGHFERKRYNVATELEVNQRIENLPRKALSIEAIFGKTNKGVEPNREAEYYDALFPKGFKIEGLEPIDDHDFWIGGCVRHDVIHNGVITDSSHEDETGLFKEN